MIDSFVREYEFLSNFYPAEVIYQGIKYKNNEAAFQAQKTKDIKDRFQFSSLNPSEAKKLGRRIELRSDWEQVKTNVMYEICLAKFTQNADLKQKLLDTHDEYLEEGNTWNDKVWGTVNGVGENRLGKILMRVREELSMDFDLYSAKNECVEWIRKFFDENGKGCNAIIGISGGKDSSVVAALCVEALGKDRVIGVLMPNGEQADIDDAVTLCEFLGIRFTQVNIRDAYNGILNGMGNLFVPREDGSYVNDLMTVSEQTKVNLPPRLRMAALYAVSQSLNGRVANTCNLSEDWIGYSTRYGDSVGDFSPVSMFTSDEVVAIGDACGLPYNLTHKTPADGLCGKTDEDNFGFTYAVLNKYIRTGVCNDEATKQKIDEMHRKNKFKLELMPHFEYRR